MELLGRLRAKARLEKNYIDADWQLLEDVVKFVSEARQRHMADCCQEAGIATYSIRCDLCENGAPWHGGLRSIAGRRPVHVLCDNCLKLYETNAVARVRGEPLRSPVDAVVPSWLAAPGDVSPVGGATVTATAAATPRVLAEVVSVGRLVHYVQMRRAPTAPLLHLAAIVTGLSNLAPGVPGCVDLFVMTADGTFNKRDIRHDERVVEGTWHWPERR